MNGLFYGLQGYGAAQPDDILSTGINIEDIEASNEKIFELAPGATVEEVQAMFFSDKALKLSTDKMYRLDRDGHRYYYTFNESGEPLFFPSITTLISQTIPKEERLIKWIADMGYEKANDYKVERGNYGTFMHGQYARLMINREYDLERLDGALETFIESESLPRTFFKYADSLRKNMLSLAQFIIDYDFEPIAIEMPLINRQGGYALTLDVCGYITVKKERFLCIIDFKSGKGFHEENEIQLKGQMDTWNQRYPKLPVSKIYNWRPKDWRNSPTYEFKDQSDSPNLAKLTHILGLARIEDKKLDNMLTICKGVIDLNRKDISENYRAYSLAELVKARTQDKTPITDNTPAKGQNTAPVKTSSKKQVDTPPKDETPPEVEKTPISSIEDIKEDLFDLNMDF